MEESWPRIWLHWSPREAQDPGAPYRGKMNLFHHARNVDPESPRFTPKESADYRAQCLWHWPINPQNARGQGKGVFLLLSPWPCSACLHSICHYLKRTWSPIVSLDYSCILYLFFLKLSLSSDFPLRTPPFPHSGSIWLDWHNCHPSSWERHVNQTHTGQSISSPWPHWLLWMWPHSDKRKLGPIQVNGTVKETEHHLPCGF